MADTSDRSLITENRSPLPLTFIKAIELKIKENIQPSGLAWCDSHLLFVSDRHDQEIFEIDLNDNHEGQIRSFRTFTHPGSPAKSDLSSRFISKVLSPLGKTFDWEGLSCVNNEKLLLASESFNAVLEYDIASGKARWITTSLSQAAQAQHFFGRTNAGLEGLALIDQEHLLLAFERQPRGLALLTQQTPNTTLFSPTRWQQIDASNTPDAYTGDISDVWSEGGHIYTLERFQHTICRRQPQTWTEESCWHFTDVEYAPYYRYDDIYPGHAEGMTRHQDNIYIVTDNNYIQREAIKGNRNPLLFIFQTPEDWLPEKPDNLPKISDGHDETSLSHP